MNVETVVIFGGGGFIGSHLANYFVEQNAARKIVIADIQPSKPFLTESTSIEHVETDVRKPIDVALFPDSVDLIINLAAVHREPGHEACQYFETNIRGAENVCDFATAVGCRKMFFTSSIAPYGPSEEEKREDSLTVPLTPYGSSKLCAEKIHQIWLGRHEENSLCIVRPGVVFGPGESGNVTRMVRGVLSGRFIYVNNKQVVKAGGYVLDLCRSLGWVLDRMEQNDEKFVLYNFTLDPPPSIETYVSTIIEVSGRKRHIRNFPALLLMAIAKTLDVLLSVSGVNNPVDPVRVKKLVRSNNIRASYLTTNGFTYAYPLKKAFEHWKKSLPSDWK